MGVLSKEQLRELIKEKHLVTADDVQNMLKEMFAETLQEMLEGELDTELGYPKNGSTPAGGGNRRNGHTKKMENWTSKCPETGRGISNRPSSRSIRRTSRA